MYSVPSSVGWVTETTRACTACSSPRRTTRRAISSGVSLPSGVGTVSSLTPAIASAAPHSSTSRWADSAQMTASHGRHIARRATMFAPLPLNAKNVRAPAPKRSANSASTRSVSSSWP